MKLKSLLLVICFSLFPQVFEANLHINSKANESDKKSIAKETTFPGYCEIEVINDSYSDVRVYGTYDDGSIVDFNIYRFEAPHYISLYYYLYCHSGMYLTIQSSYGVIYSAWTSVDSSIRIVPYLDKKAKIELSHR